MKKSIELKKGPFCQTQVSNKCCQPQNVNITFRSKSSTVVLSILKTVVVDQLSSYYNCFGDWSQFLINTRIINVISLYSQYIMRNTMY